MDAKVIKEAVKEVRKAEREATDADTKKKAKIKILHDSLRSLGRLIEGSDPIQVFSGNTWVTVTKGQFDDFVTVVETTVIR